MPSLVQKRELEELLQTELHETYKLLGDVLPDEPLTSYKGECGGGYEGPRHEDYCLGLRHNTKIGEILETLKRVRSENYGICEECEEDISFSRLKAYPRATHCVNCQEEIESKNKRDGKGKLLRSDSYSGQSYLLR